MTVAGRHIFNVVEIFDSLEGEGKRAGATATFIRLAGCNLRCGYCDTTHALDKNSGTVMTLDEILDRINPAYKRVTLTGGEPLLAAGVDDLVMGLLAKGCEVNIETNGSIDIKHFRERVTSGGVNRGGLFFTIDYKLPSSGECDKMLEANYFSLCESDVIKFVLGNEEDVYAMNNLVERVNDFGVNREEMKPQIFIGSIYGAFGLPALAEIIIKNPILKDARMQLQFHKIIWGPDKQGV
ncbi:MAG: radical SAM protein [Defluviitaleaceae bacterium]|nr:radical SAM protein [Defluviitaleaceae bacterium]